MKLTKDDIKPVGRLWKDRELAGCEYVLPLSRLREVVKEFQLFMKSEDMCPHDYNLLHEEIEHLFGGVLE